jgi:hypothetical protein
MYLLGERVNMNDLLDWLIIIVVVGLFVVFIVYLFRWIFRGIRSKKRDRKLVGKGWYFINERQTPRWIKNKWTNGIDWSHGTVTEILAEARGKHFEYKLVVVDSGHTHACAVIRRRLRKHR